MSKIAEKCHTPLYVYSLKALIDNCQSLLKAFQKHPTLVCYAIKSNHNQSILREIFNQGIGADIVSRGELERVIRAGERPERIVFSGVGKQDAEIQRALEFGILSFNVESFFELKQINRLAQQCNKQASVMIRINPNIEVNTNRYIATGLYETKFGVAEDQLPLFYDYIRNHKNLKLIGLSCHIGSQIIELEPYELAVRRMVELTGEAMSSGFELTMINLGGGLGIKYADELPPSFEQYANIFIKHLGNTKLKLIIEPGRALVGNAGVLVTKVISVKKQRDKYFIIVDAAMNDLIRPALYHAYHDILPVRLRTNSESQEIVADVVGPICETGDFLGLGRKMRMPEEGDLLFINSCGAYAATMASNYNSRLRAAEVLVNGSEFKVVCQREQLEDLWRRET